jgi:hypothetical protein
MRSQWIPAKFHGTTLVSVFILTGILRSEGISIPTGAPTSKPNNSQSIPERVSFLDSSPKKVETKEPKDDPLSKPLPTSLGEDTDPKGSGPEKPDDDTLKDLPPLETTKSAKPSSYKNPKAVGLVTEADMTKQTSIQTAQSTAGWGFLTTHPDAILECHDVRSKTLRMLSAMTKENRAKFVRSSPSLLKYITSLGNPHSWAVDLMADTIPKTPLKNP